MAGEAEKRIWQGFSFGLGLLIPMAFAVMSGEAGWSFMSSFMQGVTSPDTEYAQSEYAEWDKDFSADVEVMSFRDTRLGTEVLILGSVKNNGKKVLSSIEIEAEFFDEKGQFVYETSTTLRRGKLQPGQVENFQISCGCKDKPFPVYKRVKVSVVAARVY